MKILIALVAAVVLFMAGRHTGTKQLKGEFGADLYYAHIQAVDSNTSTPVNCTLQWDLDAISPFMKGSGPTVIESLDDGSKIFSLVGVHPEDPVIRIEVTADGYESDFVDIPPQGSGILTQDSNHMLRTVQLKPTSLIEEAQ